MITAFIVISSVILGGIFTLAWLLRPELRRQIESPKHNFQEQIRAYNQQCHDTHEEAKVKGGCDESG
jgi:hypothetical protein